MYRNNKKSCIPLDFKPPDNKDIKYTPLHELGLKDHKFCHYPKSDVFEWRLAVAQIAHANSVLPEIACMIEKLTDDRKFNAA